MKKVLALVLAFTLVFSSISFVFADEEVAVSDEGAALVTLGMLSGADGGYTAEYEAEELTRLQAAAAILKLKGLYEDAIAFDGVDNFADVADYAWVEGRNLMAYMKANPELGFIGDGVNFNPGAKIDEQSYYKVLLETLGYKQNVGEVVGDFAWEETLEFAEKVGLKPAGAEKFTVGDLAKATVAALKAETKDGKVYIDALIEAGKVTEEKAVVAGFKDEAPVLVEVAVKEVKALGNTVVQVEFKEAVGAEAENLDNYAIDGLEIKGALVSGEKLVQLETVAQATGKIYKLVIGEDSYQFAGVAKVSGAPELTEAKSEDVEEVVLTFDKNIDLVTGSDVDNYTIGDVEIVEAVVDGDEVTLTTEGLKNKTQYTIKVTNIKSIDGTVKKSDSKKFRSSYDVTAPKIDTITPETYTRIVVKFNEKVTQDTAEDIENYTIKLDKTDGYEVEILDAVWDSKDKKEVTITTEAMERKGYKVTVNGISDARKVPNVMTRPLSATFSGVAEDKSAPVPQTPVAQSPTRIMIEFKDDSKVDEDTVLDINNYSSKNLDIEGIVVVTNELGLLKAYVEVDEMKTGDRYELIVENIADEFGNVMKKEKSFSNISAKADNFESAHIVVPIAVKDKETLEVTFSKELDKATAENIANYFVNNEIGAPKKAKLNDDKNVVKLTVNEMIEGYKYQLTVDGVEDLLGNELYFKSDATKFTATVSDKPWDKSKPELESVEVLNKFVISLAFDEKVNPSTGTKLQLATYDTTAEDFDTVNLVEFDYFCVVEDDTVVEFSNVGLAVYLDPDVVYAVYGVPGIKDYAGNLLADITLGDFEFDGTKDEPDGVVMDYYEQKNGVEFKVVFEEDVKDSFGSISASVKDGDQSKGTVGFAATRDNDDHNIVYLKIADGSVIKEDYDYRFDFASIFEDLHGIAVAEDDYEKVGDTVTEFTVLTGEYTDEDAPEIDEIVVKNRTKIEIVFNEDIEPVSYANFFTIKNLDLDKNDKVEIQSANGSKKKITLILKTALEARYEYELTFVKGDTKIIKDLAGNKLKGDDDRFYFYGTNLSEK